MLQDFLKSINSLYTDQQELAAIWLEYPVNGTRRITAGDTVRIENGKLVNGEPTHKIVLCLGTLVSKFEIVAVGLEDNEPLIVKL